MERVQQRAARMIRGLKMTSCEKKVKQLGMFHFGHIRLRMREDKIVFFRYSKGCQIEGQILFSTTPACMTWNNGLKLQRGWFYLNASKNVLRVRPAKPITQKSGGPLSFVQREAR